MGSKSSTARCDRQTVKKQHDIKPPLFITSKQNIFLKENLNSEINLTTQADKYILSQNFNNLDTNFETEFSQNKIEFTKNTNSNNNIIFYANNTTNKLAINIARKCLSSKGGSLNKDIRKYYKFREVIGGGHFGTVRIAYKIGNDQIKFYAVKSISKNNLTQKNLIKLLKEVDILSSLDHPNIIKLFETYHDNFYFHIVMELCEGKEVFEKITEDGNITEEKATKYIFQLLNAILYCHSKGVTHRDLKPENILLETKKEDSEIKLIDFGSSRVYNSKEKMHSMAGTPYYIAPEVLYGEYDEKCDIWSIGAITYTMLCGEPPFNGENNSVIFQNITKKELIFDKEKWKNISPVAIDFVKKCMVKTPGSRWSAIQAVTHPWFQNLLKQIHDVDNIPKDILENLCKCEATQRLKRLVLKYFVNYLSEDYMKRLRKAFCAINLDHTGCIKKEELINAFKLYDLAVSHQFISNIFEDINEKCERNLGYIEFLIRSFDQKKYITKEKLLASFQYFDIDNDGKICLSDLKNAMLRSGRDCINDEEIYIIIDEISQNRKDVTVKEFLYMFNYIE